MFEALKQMFTGGAKKETGPTLEQLYVGFLTGKFGQNDLVAALTEEQVDSFCEIHRKRSKDVSPDEDRRIVFKMNQLDGLTENNGLELRKKVIEAHGGTTISKWN